MTAARRWIYHTRTVGRDALWLPALVGGLFWLVLATAPNLRHPSALTLWSEIVLPGLAALASAYSVGPAGDDASEYALTLPLGGWRLYIERYGLLLGAYLAHGLAVGWLIAATLLPDEGLPIALQATVAGLPPLLLFSAFAMLSSELLRGSTGGAVTATGCWLAALMARSLAYRQPWESLYPFETFFHASSPAWALNRTALLLLGLLLLAGFALRVRRGGY